MQTEAVELASKDLLLYVDILLPGGAAKRAGGKKKIKACDLEHIWTKSHHYTVCSATGSSAGACSTLPF